MKSGLFFSAALVVLCATTAFGATVSGVVTNDLAAPLAGMQVRLYAAGANGKGWVVAASTTTDGAGAYTLIDLDPGDYRLHARMAPGVSGNYGDRWYDVAPPNSNGYISADADVITLAATDALTVNLTLEVLGGFDGRVTANGVPFYLAHVRGERSAEPRIHHNDLSAGPGPHAGRFYMRGMVPDVDYRFLAHDLDGAHETYVNEGPFAVSTGQNSALPDFALTPMTADPNEPNNDSSTAVSIDAPTLFRVSPPQPFVSSGALIGPRNGGDVDWYCFDALAGDRFLLSAQSVLTLSSGTRENPFVDPVLALYSGDGVTRILEDDDSGPLRLDTRIDTGVIAADGRYCAVVSTFGDTAFDGTSQASAGRYELRVEMGNHKPTLSATIGGTPAPTPPATVALSEGSSITFDLTWSDPDGDVLTPAAVLLDNTGTPVTTGAFAPGVSGGTFTWTATQVAAQKSPYTVKFSIADAEFTESMDVVIAVDSVNLTPSMPAHVSPANGSTVGANSQALVITNAADGDDDALSYEFEVFYGDSTTPALTHTEPEGTGGQTSWTLENVPENTHVRWRVRAFDGQADSAYSPWTMEWSFVVDVANDPPAAPVLTKPDESEVVMMKRPVLSALNPIDPEGDDVVLVFQIASDAAFTQGRLFSPEVPASTTGNSTTWTVPQDLPWGSKWFARVYAKDARGGESPMSNVHAFSIKPNLAPSVPTFGEPFDVQCEGVKWTDGHPTSVVVQASTDPEGEAVSIQLKIVPFDGDPDASAALFDRTEAQASGATSTTFDLSGVPFTEDQRYRIRARATDTLDASDWAECDVTLDAQQSNDGNGVEVKEGCGCNSTQPATVALVALLALVGLGRRRRFER